MTNIVAVTRRELGSYFVSPLAYVVIALFLVLSGFLFFAILQSEQTASLTGLIQNVSVLFLFIVPVISMRLLAEEQRTGTVELLLTNPVQEWEIVVGKFVASFALLLVMLVLTLLYPAFLFAFGKPDVGPIITGYAGIVLQAAAFMSVGLWASSVTQNQIIAAVFAFAMLLVLWLSSSLGQAFGTGLVGSILTYLSTTDHFTNFPNGVIMTKDVVYYLTIVAGGIILSTLSLQARRVG